MNILSTIHLIRILRYLKCPKMSIRAGSAFGAWNKFKKSWLRDNPNTKNSVQYAGVKMIIE